MILLFENGKLSFFVDSKWDLTNYDLGANYMVKMSVVILFFSIAQCTTVTSNSYETIQPGSAITTFDVNFWLSSKESLKFQKIISSDWESDRSGLIDLDHPKAKSAGLKSGEEPIQIYFYSIEHPKYGTFFIDSGLSSEFKKDQNEWPIQGLLAKVLNISKIKIRESLKDYMIKNPKTPNSVFLTHLHFDHILGLYDLSEDIPVITGPNEATDTMFQNIFVKGTTDKLLKKNRKIIQLKEVEIDKETGLGIIDYFKDGSFLILHVPGHTEGSLAFLLKTTSGPKLIVGDTSHTKFGWENQVTPGYFSKDQKKNADSLQKLFKLAKKIPGIEVHLGHQSLK
ncbi:MBL fold metallo-hydrolase [Leptospira sp. 96542]|nr:MBL fold metallo-hydrolase [Leptospira sp. 96542]